MKEQPYVLVASEPWLVECENLSFRGLPFVFDEPFGWSAYVFFFIMSLRVCVIASLWRPLVSYH